MRFPSSTSLVIFLIVAGCNMSAVPGRQENASNSAPPLSHEQNVADSAVTIPPRTNFGTSGPLQKPMTDQPRHNALPARTATLNPVVEAQLERATERAYESSDSHLRTPIFFEQHVVTWGETLSLIAARYGASVTDLMAINGLQNPDLLQLGQVIKLPSPPQSYTPGFAILPDSSLVRSKDAADFDLGSFIAAQPGILASLKGAVITRLADGSARTDILPASDIVKRVSLEYSVDPRILLAILEYHLGLLSRHDLEQAQASHPLFSFDAARNGNTSGLVDFLSWLADQLNRGYYGWKYRNRKILALSDGTRLWHNPELNAGTIAVQYVLSQLSDAADWEVDVSDAGLSALYNRYFGDPFQDAIATVPQGLSQPPMTLPFPRGEIWLFTGGFHGGWGDGSAWAAVDFAPPAEQDDQTYCYISSFPVSAVAAGSIVRLNEGVVVLDLDRDGNEGSGWTILYLHINQVSGLREGQVVEAGQVLGYASCLGGFSYATHLHIARRHNGEWIPADCAHCPMGVNIPPFVMSNWQVIGLEHQVYQGFMFRGLDNSSVVAEQGRTTSINEISW